MAASKFHKHAASPSGDSEHVALRPVHPEGRQLGGQDSDADREERSIILDSQIRTAYAKVGHLSDHIHIVGRGHDADKVHREPVTLSTVYGPFTDQPEPSSEVPAGAPVFDQFNWSGTLDAGNPACRTFGTSSRRRPPRRPATTCSSRPNWTTTRTRRRSSLISVVLGRPSHVASPRGRLLR